jgi:transposase-like protein
MDRIAAGESVAEVARTFGVDRATVYRLRSYQDQIPGGVKQYKRHHECKCSSDAAADHE